MTQHPFLDQNDGQLEKLKSYQLITYILYLVSFVVGFTFIVAIIMNYLKRGDVKGTWLESHNDWQIRTFWWSLLGYIVGGLLTLVLIGFVVLFVVFIWHVYRLIKGLMALNENKPVG